jgi:hypothetical protein
VAKAFHVSPFLPRDLEYRMSFSPAAQTRRAHGRLAGRETVRRHAELATRALDRASLHRYLRRFPWMTAKTCLAIYWQALRLLLKRAPIFAHQAADGSFKSPLCLPRIAAMKSSSLSVKSLQHQRLDRLAAARGVLRQLSQLKHGQLVVIEDGERLCSVRRAATCWGNPDPRCGSVGLVAGNGSIGAGEAFIHGYWSSPDLTAVVRVFVSNLDVLDAMEGGLASLSRPLVQGLHWLNRNTRKGSQKNIAAHYDLGNDLFEQFLDPTMMYSAAQFLSPRTAWNRRN